jgi:alanyl-tRNA synthetase
MKLDEIRDRFLEYFKRNAHEVVKSSSLIPEGDPTLLFTNAGMNQFKDVFLGNEKRSYNRASTSQKCFRASGKHNDLENVGRTARHHTFFEMLGNFSFGDYFKKDAVRFAWEFMTVDMALPEDKLWITVYKDDDEAFDLWQEVAGVPADKILRMGEKDNFWAMGETGPCGPCSEIHIDQGPELGCDRPGCHVGCECDRYLELWNLVFMQYNRDRSGEMTPLPRPSIDTGMGLERIAAVKQGVFSNYDTDLFQAIIKRISDLTGVAYGKDQKSDVSLRVIADHARAMAFLIADGVLPLNEGRGYVLRRVMRRAGRHAKMLGKDEPVLYRVAEVVGELMGGAFPELIERKSFIAEVIKNEEERFLETLDSGLKILGDEMKSMKKSGHGKISGDVAFKLYDTFGFPIDLTQVIAEEEGLEVDMQGFELAMQAQRDRAREHWKGSGEHTIDMVFMEIKNRHGNTEFVGYETIKEESKVVALVQAGKTVESVSGPGAEFQLVAEKTPFYGESGGQVGDIGRIIAKGLEIKVTNAARLVEDQVVHHCVLEKGKVKAGDAVTLEVNAERRADIMRNHSATHLLQYALRTIIGDHVHQKGSLVAPDRFRFDLTNFAAVNHDQQQKIEALVNQKIRENHEVKILHLSHKEAVAKGAMALFGEKYGETVRMVEMGDFSRELCGGTHAGRTGDIGMFKIVAESSVAAGVRRIEAVTGRAAVALVQDMENRMLDAADCLKAGPDEIKDRIKKLQDEVKALQRELKAEKERKLTGDSDAFAKAKDVNGVKVLVTEVEIKNPKELRPLGDQFRDRVKSGVAVFGAKAGKKVHLLAVVTKDLTEKVKAGDIVAAIAPIVGGKGGGRPDFAQAGGQEPEKLEEALKRAEEMVEEKI